MSSAAVAGIFGLTGVIIGGFMTMITTWWQAVNTRKGRLAELEIELNHERLLRDEAVRRSAMLELVYALRQFSSANWKAGRNHEHNKTLGSQPNAPEIWNLASLGQNFVDLLDRNASLIDRKTRDELEVVRDRWDRMHTYNEHFPPSDRDPEHDCCPFGGDLETMEITANDGVYALERELNVMRPRGAK